MRNSRGIGFHHYIDSINHKFIIHPVLNKQTHLEEPSDSCNMLALTLTLFHMKIVLNSVRMSISYLTVLRTCYLSPCISYFRRSYSKLCVCVFC